MKVKETRYDIKMFRLFSSDFHDPHLVQSSFLQTTETSCDTSSCCYSSCSSSSTCFISRTQSLTVLQHLKAILVASTAAVPEARASPLVAVKEPHHGVVGAIAGIFAEETDVWRKTGERHLGGSKPYTLYDDQRLRLPFRYIRTKVVTLNILNCLHLVLQHH